jgi:hypothetical protein
LELKNKPDANATEEQVITGHTPAKATAFNRILNNQSYTSHSEPVKNTTAYSLKGKNKTKDRLVQHNKRRTNAQAETENLQRLNKPKTTQKEE